MSHISEVERERIMKLNRSEIIQFICSTGYIQPLPTQQQGFYLFGKTRNDRAVCLAWDYGEGQIKRDAITVATYEIEDAELGYPFIFFGRTNGFLMEDLFKFVQIPWAWEQRYEPLLPIIQGMNMRGKPKPFQNRAKSCKAQTA